MNLTIHSWHFKLLPSDDRTAPEGLGWGTEPASHALIGAMHNPRTLSDKGQFWGDKQPSSSILRTAPKRTRLGPCHHHDLLRRLGPKALECPWTQLPPSPQVTVTQKILGADTQVPPRRAAEARYRDWVAHHPPRQRMQASDPWSPMKSCWRPSYPAHHLARNAATNEAAESRKHRLARERTMHARRTLGRPRFPAIRLES